MYYIDRYNWIFEFMRNKIEIFVGIWMGLEVIVLIKII